MKKNTRIVAICAFCILTLALVAVPAFADAALPGPMDIIEDTVAFYRQMLESVDWLICQ